MYRILVRSSTTASMPLGTGSAGMSGNVYGLRPNVTTWPLDISERLLQIENPTLTDRLTLLLGAPTPHAIELSAVHGLLKTLSLNRTGETDFLSPLGTSFDHLVVRLITFGGIRWEEDMSLPFARSLLMPSSRLLQW